MKFIDPNHGSCSVVLYFNPNFIFLYIAVILPLITCIVSSFPKFFIKHVPYKRFEFIFACSIFQYLQNLRHRCFRAVTQPTSIYLRKLAGILSLYWVIKFQDLSALKLMFGTTVYFVKVYIEIQTAADLYSVSNEIKNKWRKKLVCKPNSSSFKSQKYF